MGGWGNIAALIWFAIFALFPFFNKDRLRVGDLVGGTWVVRAPKRVLDADLAGDEGDGRRPVQHRSARSLWREGNSMSSKTSCDAAILLS